MSRKRKASGPKFSLFHGPGLRLYMKWRCPECNAHTTEPMKGEGSRGITEWNADPRCPACKKKKRLP